jgi:orotidine-5'-phosphate decarboxylase
MTREELVSTIKQKQNYLCVGLDTDEQKLPEPLRRKQDGVLQFNKAMIEATREHCVGYKINTAFYEAMGAKGWAIMEETFASIPPTHFKIADAKRGDIGNTSAQYARAFFETMQADAITVAPYMGEDSVKPFLEYPGKWTIVLGLTSNKGSQDFQRLQIAEGSHGLELVPNLAKASRSAVLYEQVIAKIMQWGTPGNLMFVVGATHAADFENVRHIASEHFLLVPGVGAQGGSLAEVTRFGSNADVGLLVNSSRAVIYASAGEDYAAAATAAASAIASEMKRLLTA